MKCSSCGFENMRNAVRCARCEAQLVWEGDVRREDFIPPRARGGKGIAKARFGAGRAVTRLNRSGWPIFRHVHLLDVWSKLSRTDWIALCLSVIPGLGCVCKKKYLLGGGLFAGWGACILLGMWFFSSAFVVVPALTLAAFLHFLAVVAAAEPAKISDGRGEFWAFCLPVALFMAVCLAIALLLYLY